MTGALVLALPGLLCAVMAWDLAQPAAHVPPPSGAPVVRTPPGLGQRAAAGLLAVCASTCLASSVLLTLWAPPPIVLGAAGGSGALALVAVGRPSTPAVTRPRPQHTRPDPTSPALTRTHPTSSSKEPV